jgi:hypothetical protein
LRNRDMPQRTKSSEYLRLENLSLVILIGLT